MKVSDSKVKASNIRKVLVLISFFAPAISFASEWEYAAGNSKTYFYIDFDSVAQVGVYTKAWIRSDFIEKQDTDSYPKKQYQSSKLLYYFDCKAKMLGVTQRVSYENMFSNGDVVDSYSRKFDPKALDDVVPDSIGEALMNVICAGPAGKAKLRAENKAASQAYLQQVQEILKKQKQDTPPAAAAQPTGSSQ